MMIIYSEETKKIHFLNNLTWARHFSCSHYVQTLQTMISSSSLDSAIMIYKGEGRKEEETEVNNLNSTKLQSSNKEINHFSLLIYTKYTYFWSIFEWESKVLALILCTFLNQRVWIGLQWKTFLVETNLKAISVLWSKPFKTMKTTTVSMLTGVWLLNYIFQMARHVGILYVNILACSFKIWTLFSSQYCCSNLQLQRSIWENIVIAKSTC